MFSASNKIENYLLKRLSNYKLSISYEGRDVELCIEDKDLYNVLSFLQHDTHCQFEQLVDLVVLDCPDQEKRFHLIYIIRSLKNNTCLRVGTSIYAEINSITEIYRNASWLEREAWEMFGVFFKNNKDLRRLLTAPTFFGHPLRKDYPSSGFTEYVFRQETDMFFSVSLSLTQEYRVFDVSSPWKGPFQGQKGVASSLETRNSESDSVSEEELIYEL